MSSFFGLQTYIFTLGGLGFCTLLMGLYLIMRSHSQTDNDELGSARQVRRSAGWFLIVVFVLVQLCAGIQITFIDSPRYLYVVAYTIMCTMVICVITLVQWLCSLLRHRVDRRPPEMIMAPAVIAVVTMVGVFVSDVATGFPDEFEGFALGCFAAFVVMWMGFVISFLWWFVIQVAAYHKWLEENFSSFYHRSLHDLRYISLAAVVTIIVIFIANIVPGECWWLNTMVPVCLSALCVMLFLFSERMASVELKRKDNDHEPPAAPDAEPQQPITIPDFDQRIINERLYLTPELTLDDLAKFFGTNRTYMSRYLHQRGISFYNFINRLRIDYAVTLLAQSPNINQKELVKRCGYNNRYSLARNFKQFKGMTIRQYLDGVGVVPD